MPFSDKRKIDRFFNSIKSNEVKLDDLKNDRITVNFFKQNFKPYFLIDETEWIAKATQGDDIKTNIKNDLLPTSLSIDYKKDLEFPEVFLPYLDAKILVKTPPDSELTTFAKYTTTVTDPNADTYRIKGDSTTVYLGDFISINGFTWLSSSELTERQVPLANSKKIFFINIEYQSGGSTFRIRGRLIHFNKKFNIATGCSGVSGSDYDSFRYRVFSGDHASSSIIHHSNSDPDPYAKFNDITLSSIDGIGELVEVRSVDVGGNCEEQVTQTTEVNQTLNIVPSGDEVIEVVVEGVKQEFTGGSWSTVVSASEVFASLDSSNSVNVTEVTFLGYVPYYSSETEGRIGMSGTSDVILGNFPNDTMPYSSITLERNPDNFPTETVTSTDLFTQATSNNSALGNQIKKDLATFRIASATEDKFPRYLIKIKSGITVLSPANVDDPNPNITTQDDEYTFVSPSYTRTSSDSGTKSFAFVPSNQDVQYKILLIMHNPYFYQEIRDYDTEQ